MSGTEGDREVKAPEVTTGDKAKSEQELKKQKSNAGTTSLVCGTIGLVLLFIIPFAGVLCALLLGIIAIITGGSALSKGKGIAGFIIGLVDILFAVAFIIPSCGLISHDRDRTMESLVKENMHTVQLALEDFSNATKDGLYPTSLSDTTQSGKKFSDLLDECRTPRSLRNPYAPGPANVEIIAKTPPSPVQGDDAKVPKGEIRIFCDGKKYLIVAGNKRGEALSVQFSN